LVPLRLGAIHSGFGNACHSTQPEIRSPQHWHSKPEATYAVDLVGFGDWLASLTGECSLDVLYAGQPNSWILMNQLIWDS